MDFFEQQRRARRRTGWLILAFFLAIFVVGALVHAVTMSFFVFFDDVYQGPFWEGPWRHPASGVIFYGSQAFVLLLVGFGSLYRIRQLSHGGGQYVAEYLGGKEISPFTLLFEEKQLLNIVEEMSIAAGILAPKVYVLEKELRINAFAAGFDPDSAVIGVTRGAVECLPRDELQAVIAHEFSHILNGDIVLNMRMIGVLYGLNMITQTGLELLRNSGIELEERKALDVGDQRVITPLIGWRGYLVCLVAGTFLITIGLVACLLGSLIKAAITRQREFLADASAVQFTRNGEALKNAFLKIGSPKIGSIVYSSHALEASHLFLGGPFGESAWWNFFASHPTWKSRIRRLDRNFDGRFPRHVSRLKRYGEEMFTGKVDEAMIDEVLSTMNPGLNCFAARKWIDQARSMERPKGATMTETYRIASSAVDAEEKMPIDRADSKRIAMPECIAESLKTPQNCCMVFYALLLDKDADIRRRQLNELEALTQRIRAVSMDRIREISEKIVESFSVQQTMSKTPEARKLRSAFIRIRNTTLRDGLPRLRELSSDDYADFRRICSHLTGDVNKINLFRYTLFAAFRNGLDERLGYGNPSKKAVQYQTIVAVEPALRLALSYLAYAGHADRSDAQNAFRAGLKIAGLQHVETFGDLLPLVDCTFPALDGSLHRIGDASPPIREKCLEAFKTVLWNDGKMTAREEEIFLAASVLLHPEIVIDMKSDPRPVVADSTPFLETIP